MKPGRARERERRRSLGLSVADGVLHAIMLGATESYLGALAVELGHRDVALSLLATIPLLAGALSQLASPRLVRLFGSEKRVVVTGIVLQALTHLAFFAIAITGSTSFEALLTAKTLYWASAASHAPAWSSWMTRLVPAPIRARFFARRMWVYHAVLVVVFVAAGFVLRTAADRGVVLLGFGALHLVSMVARLGGGVVVARQSSFGEPAPSRARVALRVVLSEGRWRVAVFMAVLLAGAQLAVPFFTPYMLQELGLDLGGYALLSVVSIAVKGSAFPVWRRISARIGPKRVLAISGAGIALVPVFWFATTDLRVIVLAQVVGGAAWAGYELSALELLMSDAPERARVEFYSLANALSGLTQVAGALVGGWLLRSGTLVYEDVFLVSAIGRGSALVALLLIPSPRRHVAAIFGRLLSVRPSGGAVTAPLVGPDSGDDERLGN